jgi:hypothetical protein
MNRFKLLALLFGLVMLLTISGTVSAQRVNYHRRGSCRWRCWSLRNGPTLDTTPLRTRNRAPSTGALFLFPYLGQGYVTSPGK